MKGLWVMATIREWYRNLRANLTCIMDEAISEIAAETDYTKEQLWKLVKSGPEFILKLAIFFILVICTVIFSYKYIEDDFGQQIITILGIFILTSILPMYLILEEGSDIMLTWARKKIRKELEDKELFAAAARDRYNSSRRNIFTFSLMAVFSYAGVIDYRSVSFFGDTLPVVLYPSLLIIISWNLYNFSTAVIANQGDGCKIEKGFWYSLEVIFPIKTGTGGLIICAIAFGIEAYYFIRYME